MRIKIINSNFTALCITKFGRRWKNVKASYTKFHVRSNYLNNLYSSPNITQFIRSIRIKWRGLERSTGDIGKKDKAVPLHVWSGPEGSRKLSFSDFMTTAQDGCKVVSLTHWLPLPPGNTPGTRFF